MISGNRNSRPLEDDLFAVRLRATIPLSDSETNSKFDKRSDLLEGILIKDNPTNNSTKEEF